MTQVLSVPAAVAPSADPTAGVGAKAPAPDVDVFRATLTQQVVALGPPAKSPQSPAASDGLKAQRALEAKITKMIASGASQADIVAALAAQLASSVAQAVDAPGTDARGKLQTLFATALAPPGENSAVNGSVADRARILAQRFVRLESLANAIAGRQSGQQNRIAGKLLDAQRAKDIPARPSTITSPAAKPAKVAGVDALASALTSTAASTSASVPTFASTDASLSTSASASSIAVAATTALQSPRLTQAALGLAGNTLAGGSPRGTSPGGGDGRTVNLGFKPAIATGGDTGLGRILSRAALAADARPTPLAPLPGDADAVDSSPSTSSAPPSPADTALSTFTKAFESALAASLPTETLKPDHHDSGAATPAQVPQTDTVTAFVPQVAPFAIDHVNAIVAPPAPAPIDHSAIADQVLRGAFMRNVGQSSEIRLSLVPDSLGDVSVKLVVDAGSVTAHVVAETPEVRDALVAAQPQLTKSLADAGLKLTSFTVDLSGGGFAGFAQQQNDRSQNDRSRRSSRLGDGEIDVDETSLEAIPSFGPSIAGTTGARDLNYLA